MSKQFEDSLQAHLEDGHKLNATERRLVRVMDLPKSNDRRKRILGRLEDTAKNKLQHDNGDNSAIDWSSIDWPALFAQLIAFIKAILALFGM